MVSPARMSTTASRTASSNVFASYRLRTRSIAGCHGFKASGNPWPGWLAEAREVGNVLVERHGFELVFDSDTLSPHETQLWYSLTYRRGETTIEITLGDLRLDEWFVRIDGKTIHYFQPWSRSEMFVALAVIESAL
jgi:hypothetical protein